AIRPLCRALARRHRPHQRWRRSSGPDAVRRGRTDRRPRSAASRLGPPLAACVSGPDRGLWRRRHAARDTSRRRGGHAVSARAGLLAVHGCHWDAVVIDEAHGLGERTDREHAAAALCLRAAYVILLTGTPHNGDSHAFHALCSLGGGGDPLLTFRRTRAEAGL